jgi:hypothetical protein
MRTVTDGALGRAQGYGILTSERAPPAAAHDWVAECQALLRLKGFVWSSTQVILLTFTPLQCCPSCA